MPKQVKAHLEDEHIEVEIDTPEHGERSSPSKTFRSSKDELMVEDKIPALYLERVKGRCFICNKTEQQLGQPLEAHHFGIEWSQQDAAIDWTQVKKDHANFLWDHFDPAKPEKFVDDMWEQGLLLCKKHHTGKGTGIHDTVFSFWIMQRYLKNGTEFFPGEVIDRAEDEAE